MLGHFLEHVILANLMHMHHGDKPYNGLDVVADTFGFQRCMNSVRSGLSSLQQ